MNNAQAAERLPQLNELREWIIEGFENGEWFQLIGALEDVVQLAQQKAQLQLSLRAQLYLRLLASQVEVLAVFKGSKNAEVRGLDVAMPPQILELHQQVVSGLEHLEWVSRAQLSKGEHQ